MRRRTTVLLLFGATIAGVAISASLSGARATPRQHEPAAANLTEVVAEVRKRLGSGPLLSVVQRGPTLTVKVAMAARQHGSDVGTVAIFDAAVLAHAIADWQSAEGKVPATRFRVTAGGKTLPGPAWLPIGTDASAEALPARACQSARDRLPRWIDIVSDRILPMAGGTCVFKLQTAADPTAAAEAMRSALIDKIPESNRYPSLIEVDDRSGVPQIVLTWVPGTGGGYGEGNVYVRPGLSSPFSR